MQFVSNKAYIHVDIIEIYALFITCHAYSEGLTLNKLHKTGEIEQISLLRI